MIVRKEMWCYVAGIVLSAGGLHEAVYAQEVHNHCSSLSATEEIKCLRRSLAEAQEALSRAERMLQSPVIPLSIISPTPGAILGAEQVEQRSRTASANSGNTKVSTVIVASERVHPNRLEVQLDNGQTWRQIQGDTQQVQLPAGAPIAAEIWRSGFGGYRMRLLDMRRVLKVERIR